MLAPALRLLGVLVASTVVGAAILHFCVSFHLQIPDSFVEWLPNVLRRTGTWHVDGESAYDAGLTAFYIEINALGIVLYLAIRRTFRPVAR
jgi:hypothetical protein